MALDLALDCRHYRGDRPCQFRKRCHCDHYDPMGFRILVIKLAALGDVIRTACLLPTLKQIHPRCFITWVSKASGVRILSGHPLIDRLVTFDAEGILALTQQRQDLVLSLDKEPAPTALCNAVSCPDKRGITMSPCGTPMPCNPECEDYFELGLDDDLKFNKNQLSYPELIHAAVGLPYDGQRYCLHCDDDSLSRARAMFAPWRAGSTAPMVGLNTGAGAVFANKAPSKEKWAQVARALIERGCAVVLLGGPLEEEENAWIKGQVSGPIHDAGCRNTEAQFVAIVDECDLVVTGDTLGLHVAVARGVGVVALLGPTCAQEIELFGLGEKIVSAVECAPCYRRRCDREPNCMDAISVGEIVRAAEAVLARRGPG